MDATAAFAEGARVKARYLASTLGAAVTKWYPGVVRSVSQETPWRDDLLVYKIAYDDGEVEEGVLPRFIKRWELPLHTPRQLGTRRRSHLGLHCQHRPRQKFR